MSDLSFDPRSCGASHGPIDSREVERRFLEQQQQLLDQGWDRVDEVRLGWALIRERPRTMAHTRHEKGAPVRIELDPAFLRLVEDHREAILRHEWGHVLDVLYPASIDGVRDGVPVIVEPTEEDMQVWNARSDDEWEWAADELAEGVFGEPIRYKGACLLQSLRAGTPRPAGLR